MEYKIHIMAVDLSEFPRVLGDAAAMLIGMWILTLIRPGPQVLQDGSKVVRYHRSYEFIGWIGSVLFFALLVGSLLAAGPKDRNFCVGVFGGLTLLGLSMVWVGRRCKVYYTNSGVCYVPFFGAPFSFPWDSIVDARFSILGHWWVFTLDDGRKIRISTYMNGHRDFIQTARFQAPVGIPDRIV
jgi:hypothetical protein